MILHVRVAFEYVACYIVASEGGANDVGGQGGDSFRGIQGDSRRARKIPPWGHCVKKQN